MISLDQQFKVSLPVDEAWTLLIDLPQVARCMPGASLDDVVDGEYRGGLSTKIGPITARYRGVALFREQDDVAHRAVIEARGQEEKGSGSASAVITLQLRPDAGDTLVEVSAELLISGRAAQFGRSLMSEVCASMLEQFARRLQEMIAHRDDPADSLGSGSAAAPARFVDGSRGSAGPDGADPSLDLVRVVVLPILRRAALPAATAIVGGLVGALIARRGRRGPSGRAIPLTYVLPYPGASRDAFAGR